VGASRTAHELQATEQSSMIFRQLIHDDLSCASYLIGDEDAGVAAVVDPKFEIKEDLALARYMGVRIEHLLEPTTTPTTSPATAASPPRPAPRPTSTASPHPTIRAPHTHGHLLEHPAFALIDTARGQSRGRCSAATPLFVSDIPFGDGGT
jgi:hydroxyacylglutathione hydrolase